MSKNRSSSDQPAARISAESQAILQQLLVRPIAYFPVFARIGGGATAGLMLSQFFYWTPRTHDPDGWFFKTQKQCQDETGLTRDEQDTARRRLIQRELIEEKLAGLPAKRHFRINMERVVHLLIEAQKEGVTQFEGNPQTSLQEVPQSSLRETRKLGGVKPANLIVANTQTITESTTESTAEITHTKRADVAANKRNAKERVGVAEETVKAGKEPTSGKQASSRFTLDECEAYARSLETIKSPRGFAKKIHATGEDDEQINRFLHSSQQEAAGKLPPEVNVSRCPDCNGTGYWYPEGTAKGVARCRHSKLKNTQSASTSSVQNPQLQSQD